jgi:hypothetical protein
MTSQKYVARKDLAVIYGRSYEWARRLARRLEDHGGRFREEEADRLLRAGFKPYGSQSTRKAAEPR